MSSPSGTINSFKTSTSTTTLYPTYYPTYYPIPPTSPPPSPPPPSSRPHRPKPPQLPISPNHNRTRSKSYMPITPLLTDFTPTYCSFASFPETADMNGVYGPSVSVQPPKIGWNWEWRPWEWELDGKWSLGGRVVGVLVSAVVACSLVVSWVILDRHKFRHA